MGPDDPVFKAVLANPDDDDVRRAYSDYLEESGDPHALTLAQYIRLTIDADLLRAERHRGHADYLDQQAQALYQRHVRRWNGALHRFLHRTPLRMQVDARRGLIRRWEYRHGFVEKLVATAQAFLDHADVLFRLGPLREVGLLRCRGLIDKIAVSPALWRLKVLDLSVGHQGELVFRPLFDACRAAGGPVLRLRTSNLIRAEVNRARADGHQLVGA
jgi:uncharacterized protein (TIGR02996 family)